MKEMQRDGSWLSKCHVFEERLSDVSLPYLSRDDNAKEDWEPSSNM